MTKRKKWQQLITQIYNTVSLRRTANISWHHRWFPYKMTSKEKAQILSLSTQIWVVLLNGKAVKEIYEVSINQKHNPDLGRDTSPVWNFCSFSLDVLLGVWGKPAIALSNVSHFLRLLRSQTSITLDHS